ncbi:sensor histidine kinase [Methylomagnum ishizawai]|uniref:sensor histidine kinase n=1 Tax=Methylomagnum ishizawai TaxID=1760988 RepID=UPI001C333891|nr:sensor histidine kinase [Methylomagnum ishizawai]BBL74217.1 hypothetical protein MishRS11D_13150 [Methylomagnum ishizawai]
MHPVPRPCRAWCVWLLWALFAPAAWGGGVLAVTSAVERVAARSYTGFLDDPRQTLALAEVLADPGRFVPAGRYRSGLGGVAMRWARLPLLNTGAVAGHWLLALGVPDAEVLEVYRVADGHTATLARLGPDADFAARPVPSRMLAVPVELAAGERAELYLRYRTHANTPLSLELSSPERFQRDLAEGDFVNGLVVGLLLALTVFALLQYLALGRAAFLAYMVLALLMAVFVLEFEGYGFQYLWPRRGAWNQDVPFYLTMGIQVGHALFAVLLFDLRRESPRLFRAYLAYIPVLPLCFLAYRLGYWTWHTLLAMLAYGGLVCVTGVLCLRRGFPAAAWFLAGTTGYVLFVNFLFGLAVCGFAPEGLNPFVLPKLGYVWEAVCFATALARQVQVLRRRLEDGLRRHLAEAEQLARVEAEKNRALLAAQAQQLQWAAAGHDLAQPLASIRFGLAVLRAQAGSEAATRHIDQALDYTEGLLRALIDEAKRGYAARRRALDLEDILAEAHQRHLPAARRKGLELRYCPTGQRVEGSALVLGRILDNLIGNAIRYTARGRVLVGVRRRADGLEIQVCDTGPGFDTVRREQLLMPFAQSGTLVAERLGHGLGLHIVHALCAQSGYRLHIAAKPGRGSVFGVVVPFPR